MSDPNVARRITAITAAAELGGTERVLLDFATHAFEHGIALRVLTPRHGPLIDLLNHLGVPAEAVSAPASLLRASQRPGHVASLLPALFGLRRWARLLEAHEWVRDAEVVYSVAFKAHLAAALTGKRPVVWHLHEFPPARTGLIWRQLSWRLPDALIANSHVVGDAWGRKRRQRAEGRGQKAEGRGQKAEGRGQRVEGRGQKAEGRGQKAEGRGQRAEGRGQKGERKDRSPPIVVISNGVELDRFEPLARTHWIHNELSIPWDSRLIGMPAVFARWKGQLEVLEAFEALDDEFSNVHLVFVGGSIYDTVAEREFGEQLVERMAASPCEARIHLLPFQHRIEHVYPELDLTIHYSTRPEPFGRVILEAMACGIPVIAAAEGGPIEILGGGIGPRRETGWLAEARDPAALSRILRSALRLPTEVLRSVGDAGRRRAEDLFSARAFAARVSEVLLDHSGRG